MEFVLRPGRARWKQLGTELIIWTRTLASASVWATLIVTFGFQVARVEGRSMEPTLHDHDRLVVNKLEYRLQTPQIGDIVMLRHPNTPDLALVKRVVAGPGDTVAFRDGRMLRNGTLVREDFVPQEFRSHEDQPVTDVPQGFYFVLGDHRNDSNDSRYFGPVPQKYILGKIQVRWWPLTRATVYEP